MAFHSHSTDNINNVSVCLLNNGPLLHFVVMPCLLLILVALC